MLVSTLAVGLYSNYYTVTTLAQSFIAIMTTSLMNGIGNFAAKEKKSDQKQLFDMLLLAYHFIATLGPVSYTHLDVYKRQGVHLFITRKQFRC